jgi:hypothetical protein
VVLGAGKGAQIGVGGVGWVVHHAFNLVGRVELEAYAGVVGEAAEYERGLLHDDPQRLLRLIYTSLCSLVVDVVHSVLVEVRASLILGVAVRSAKRAAIV